ncbi:MAG: elongation factor G [Anderseniella sp.]
MEASPRSRPSGPKCAALIGPMSSGKTTLLEAILARTGAIPRQNTVASGNMVGFGSPEARAHGMSVEATVATVSNQGDSLTLVDCPGSVEYAFEAEPVLRFCDFAIVVVEADEKKLPALQLTLRRLDEIGLPRVLFLNKIDKAAGSVQQTLQMLQTASENPLLLRQIPIWKDGAVTGCIDLALERSYTYQPHAEATVAGVGEDDRSREEEARFAMLETLADHDDVLMEQLLEDIAPPMDVVLQDLTAELHDGWITPVLFGSAENGTGILRLLKTIRHDAPDYSTTRLRLDIDDGDDAVASVIKTIHTSHSGKLSVMRVLRGKIGEGDQLANGAHGSFKVSGIHSMLGRETRKVQSAATGETVALGKLDAVTTGTVLHADKTTAPDLAALIPAQSLYAVGIRPADRRDEVKLSTALSRLVDEDPSIRVEHNQQASETVLHGSGEMHLRIAVERLENRSQVTIHTHAPDIGYQETITKPVTQRGRHKKQSGGHGQYGDVMLEIRPQKPGSGFEFTNTIVGGAVPKQFIGSVESGVRDYLVRGPLGFPVVDIAVNLSDGSYHNVDSSDMAFQLAGNLAMREGMPQCGPVLLEPIMKVSIHAPSDAIASITTMVPQRRGQLLGFEPRAGWPGWDTVQALIPKSTLSDMIIELRSSTAGVATYTAEFDHLERLDPKLADQVVNARVESLAS